MKGMYNIVGLKPFSCLEAAAWYINSKGCGDWSAVPSHFQIAGCSNLGHIGLRSTDIVAFEIMPADLITSFQKQYCKAIAQQEGSCLACRRSQGGISR